MTPPTKLPKHPIAIAAEQQATAFLDKLAADGKPDTPLFFVSGPIFYAVAEHVGKKPFRLVTELRMHLLEIQQQQGAADPKKLPAKVGLHESTVAAIVNFLGECPHDEVYQLATQFNKEVQDYTEVYNQEINRINSERAAAKAIEDAKANKVVDEAVANDTAAAGGNDSSVAGSGNDTASGNLANDTIVGGGSADTAVVGDQAQDSVAGGSADSAVLAEPASAVVNPQVAQEVAN